MTARGRVALPVAVALVAVLAGCAVARDDSVGAAVDALSTSPAPTTSASPTPSTTPSSPSRPCTPRPDLPPLASLPKPGHMTPGTYMYRVQTAHHLVIGVDQNSELLSAYDPKTRKIEGFDVDVAREVARAIFGSPDAIETRAIVTGQRIPVLQDGEVDLVADAFTVTCERQQQVDFSRVYYRAHQRLLVRDDTNVRTLADLRGHKVCATASGTAVQTLHANGLVPVLVPARTDCLVALETGEVDAIVADNTILEGFKKQDPSTTLLTTDYTDEPYALGMAPGNDEFVRFVNAVLMKLAQSGCLAQITAKWLGARPPKHPVPNCVAGAGS